MRSIVYEMCEEEKEKQREAERELRVLFPRCQNAKKVAAVASFLSPPSSPPFSVCLQIGSFELSFPFLLPISSHLISSYQPNKQPDQRAIILLNLCVHSMRQEAYESVHFCVCEVGKVDSMLLLHAS